MKDLLKKPVRGGLRAKASKLTSQQLVLHNLWKHFGGNTSLCKKTGVPAQNFINWRAAGKVPLEDVGQLARSLEVSVYLLNYEQAVLFLGGGPKWRDLVKECAQLKDTASAILKAEQPSSIKEILTNATA